LVGVDVVGGDVFAFADGGQLGGRLVASAFTRGLDDVVVPSVRHVGRHLPVAGAVGVVDVLFVWRLLERCE